MVSLARAAATTTVASSSLGITAVTHSSGTLILTGSAGYLGGTIGALGASSVAALTAPAVLVVAGTSIVVLSGAVYFCAE